MPEYEPENHAWRHGVGAQDPIPGLLELVALESGRDPELPLAGDILVGVGSPPGFGLQSAPAFVIVGTLPSGLIAARRITAGTGITLTDNGAGATLVISAASAGGVSYVPFGSEAAIGEAYTH